MDIATAKARATTRTGLPQTHLNSTWQHDIKSLANRKQVDGSIVC